MTETTKSKKNVILLLCFLSFAVSFVAAGALVIALFPQEQDEQPVLQPALPSLIAEPNRLDFQGVKDEKHEAFARN